jgi:hypothetical protein
MLGQELILQLNQYQENMVKRIIIAVLVFLVGFVFIAFIDNELQELIRCFFKLSLNENIIFLGKNFYLFPSWFVLISFPFLFAIFWLINSKYSYKIFIQNLLIAIVLFFISLLIISFIYANFKLMECTQCEDGAIKIHYNSIRYSLIIVSSTIISLIPSIISFYRRKIISK